MLAVIRERFFNGVELERMNEVKFVINKYRMSFGVSYPHLRVFPFFNFLFVSRLFEHTFGHISIAIIGKTPHLLVVERRRTPSVY